MGGPLLRPALVLLGLTLAGGCGQGGSAQPEPDQRPNVVVLMTDDQTLESMRVMPGVRRMLAERGTTFSRSFVSFPLCCPSRATFMTGQYAHNHGVLGNRPPTGGYGRLRRRETLPVWLDRAGYETMHVGKFLNRYGQDLGPYHVPPGWDEWQGSIDPSTYQYTGVTLNENGSLSSYPGEYSTDLYAERAVELIEDAASEDEPFFLSVGFLAPHTGGPGDPDDPPGLATPSPATASRRSRCRKRCGRPSTRPTCPTSRPSFELGRGSPGCVPPPSGRATGSGSSRCWRSTRRWCRSSAPSATRASWRTRW
jgi:hypothetical protein